jgi:hypothetical protein
MLKPASPGTGIVAGGSTRAMLEAAGVKDVLAKSLGSSNKVNTAWATMAALRRLKRASDVARLRGKNVGDLVSRSVAEATLAAEQEDAAHGIAAVVADQSVSPVVDDSVSETAQGDEVLSMEELASSDLSAADAEEPSAPEENEGQI